jgi:hypothetical protein
MPRHALLVLALSVAAASGCNSGESPDSNNPTQETQVSPEQTTSETSQPTGTAESAEHQFLAGNVSAPFPEGEAGQVAIVAQAPLPDPFPEQGNYSLPLVVRNNVAEPIENVEATATVRTPDGQLVATAVSQGFHPARVGPGEIAIGFVYFSPGTAVSPGSNVEISVSAKPSPSPQTYRADIEVLEVNNTGMQLVGTGRNVRDHGITGPISVTAVCFDAAGAPTASPGGFANEDTADAQATVSFTVDLYGESCQSFLLGVSGYDETALRAGQWSDVILQYVAGLEGAR